MKMVVLSSEWMEYLLFHVWSIFVLSPMLTGSSIVLTNTEHEEHKGYEDDIANLINLSDLDRNRRMKYY